MKMDLDKGKPGEINYAAGGPLRSCAYVVLFAVAFFATAQFFRWLIPTPIEEPRLTVRLEHFLSHKDDYDLLFLGASMMYRAINPVVLDQEMSRQGCPVQSFNLSVPSLNVREELHILRSIAAVNPKKLTWVILDPVLQMTPSSFEQASTSRVLAYNSLSSVPISLVDLRASPADTFSQVSLFLYWVYGFGFEQFSVGRLTYSDFALRLRDQSSEFSEDFFQFRGHVPLELEADDDYRRRHEEYLGERSVFGERVDWLISHPLDTGWANPRLLNLLDRRLSQLPANIQPGLIFIPYPEIVWIARRLNEMLRRRRPDLPVFHFNDPAQYPKLFQLENWFDRAHMNSKGAQLVSVQLAGSLCQNMKSEK